MPNQFHSKKQKRMAKHVFASCKKKRKVCKRIAWATVNKFRSKNKRRR